MIYILKTLQPVTVKTPDSVYGDHSQDREATMQLNIWGDKLPLNTQVRVGNTIWIVNGYEE